MGVCASFLFGECFDSHFLFYFYIPIIFGWRRLRFGTMMLVTTIIDVFSDYLMVRYGLIRTQTSFW